MQTPSHATLAFVVVDVDLVQPVGADVVDKAADHVAVQQERGSADAQNGLALEVTFASVNFGDRTSVLTTARTFEDLGVSAYNGAGQLLTDANNLLTAGKIVSVEARHAAAIRDLIAANSFAGSDVVDANGLDRASTPTTVLTAADTYVVTTINASGLPTA